MYLLKYNQEKYYFTGSKSQQFEKWLAKYFGGCYVQYIEHPDSFLLSKGGAPMVEDCRKIMIGLESLMISDETLNYV